MCLSYMYTRILHDRCVFGIANRGGIHGSRGGQNPPIKGGVSSHQPGFWEVKDIQSECIVSLSFRRRKNDRKVSNDTW